MNGLSHKLVQVPPGVQCFVGEEARRRRWIERQVEEVFEGWDYQEIIPPLFDYADVFAGRALTPRTYSFVGRDGSLLALRPDFTSLLAKVAAGRLADQPPPLRLFYSGEVLRYEPPKAGLQSELFQVGLEHLGGGGREADVEVLAIAAEALERLGVEGWVLALGHAGVLGGLLAEARLNDTAADLLRERVAGKDAAGVQETLERERVHPQVSEALLRIVTLAGDSRVLDQAARAVGFSEPALAAVCELRQIVDALEQAGLAGRVAIDLGEARGLDYYTGVVLRIYARGLGFELGGGGRYDTLLARFGRPMAAVGFSLGLDRLSLLLERQGRLGPGPAPDAESVAASGLAASLIQARQRRAAGVRVRFAVQDDHPGAASPGGTGQ